MKHVFVVLFISNYVLLSTATSYLGFEAKPRSSFDNGANTVILKSQFPTDGIIQGFNVYVQTSLPSFGSYNLGSLTFGLYKPIGFVAPSNGQCQFYTIKTWDVTSLLTPINAPPNVTILFNSTDQVIFKAGYTVGLSWSHYNVVPHDSAQQINYCSGGNTLPRSDGGLITLDTDTGSKEYSFGAIYSPVPADSCQVLKPCLNGATCTSTPSGFTCSCAKGFGGETCSYAVARDDPCQSIPCQNGGSCTSKNGIYSCACKAGYWGFSCEYVSGTSVGMTVVRRSNVGGSFWLQKDGFPDDGTLLGFALYLTYPTYKSAVKIGVYRAANAGNSQGQFYNVIKTWQLQAETTGYTQLVLPAADQLAVKAGDLIGFMNSGGSIPFEYTNDRTLYYYTVVSENGTTVAVQSNVGGYGDRKHSFQAIYSPANSAGSVAVDPCNPNPCVNGTCTASGSNFKCTCDAGFWGDACNYAVGSIGFEARSRKWVDIAKIWTMVLIQGFPVDGYLQGFNFLKESYTTPITLGLYRRSGGTCNFTVIKSWPVPPRTRDSQLRLSMPEPFKAGDTVGFTWQADDDLSGYGGAVYYDDSNQQNYCTGSLVPPTCEGNSFTLKADGAGRRMYSMQAIYANDPCTSSPCQNGGACTSSGVSGFACGCAVGYAGDTCTNVVPNPCDTKPCGSGGQCIRTSNTQFSCTCKAGYTGANCQIAVDPCSTKPCQNGGVCKSSGTSYTCTCAVGYSGNTCTSVVPNPCDSAPCANGGQCKRTDNTEFSCTCSAGFTGPTCQTTSDACKSSPCKNGGVCKSSGTSYTCTCAVGYSGNTCTSVVPNPCDSVPCANGGQCTRTDNTEFSCTCSDGYTGATCQTATGPCASSPCQNGGTCTNVGTTDFDCNCPDDYNDGDICAVYQNPCDSNPCRNGATCKRNSFIAFTCTCKTNYVGTFCELKSNTPPCSNLPCLNGGTCTDTSSTTYSCKCPSMWEGQACQTVHCIQDQTACPGLPYSRYALCGNCNKSVACKQKKQKVKTCNAATVPYFDRTLRKCTTARTACNGL